MCRSNLIDMLFILSALFVSCSLAVRRPDPDEKEPVISEEDKWTVTKTIYFDISINLESSGRVEIACFGDAAPNTVNNFAALAKGKYRGDPKFGYQGTKIHRVIPDFMVQGGDITSEDGTGGKSIYGPFYNDEPFIHSHNGTGYVAMANLGRPDTNNSQFFIITQRTRWLDGKHIVFGKVTEGMDLIKKINYLDHDEDNHPKRLVMIEDCGLVRHEPYLMKEEQRYA